MNVRYGFFFSLFIVFSSYGIHKDLSKKIDKEIKETFKIETYSYSCPTISGLILKELPAKFDDKNLLELKSNNQIIGYAYLGKAPSKTDTFDYLVLLDKELVVLKTKILAYREDYGGEIGSKRWLSQFQGKTKNDVLKYNDNIVAISGATISVRSMTNAMNDVLHSLKILHSKKLL